MKALSLCEVLKLLFLHTENNFNVYLTNYHFNAILFNSTRKYSLQNDLTVESTALIQIQQKPNIAMLMKQHLCRTVVSD